MPLCHYSFTDAFMGKIDEKFNNNHRTSAKCFLYSDLQERWFQISTWSRWSGSQNRSRPEHIDPTHSIRCIILIFRAHGGGGRESLASRPKVLTYIVFKGRFGNVLVKSAEKLCKQPKVQCVNQVKKFCRMFLDVPP